MKSEIGPLVPLEEGDTVTLSSELLQYFNESHASENIEIFKAHTFPWLAILMAGVALAILPYLLRLLKNKTQKKAPPSIEQLINSIDSQMPPSQLAKLYKQAFMQVLKEPTEILTFPEILSKLQKKAVFSDDEIKHFEKQFKIFDSMLYQSDEDYSNLDLAYEVKIDLKSLHSKSLVFN